MADGFIVRKGGAVTEQALAPTITEVSTTTDSITFTITNNDASTAVILYEVGDSTPDENSIELAADATSSNITVDTLDDDTEYTVSATASVTGKVLSNVASLAIETDPLLSALSFDGVDDYVTIGTDAGSSFTIEMQINVIARDTGNNTFLLAPDDYGGTGRWVFQLGGSDNRVLLFADSFSTRAMTSSINVADDLVGKWAHIAVSYNGSSVKFYLNGALEDTISSSGSKQNSGTLTLMGQPGEVFNNVILRDFRLWDTARTDQQIEDNFNVDLTGSESNLVVYYKVDEGTGTTLTDLASSFDGTIIGATWVTE
jgi:hypothetical protein